MKFFYIIFLVCEKFICLGSGFVDPHIFKDRDPRSQNVTDSTNPDPDPKCKMCLLFILRLLSLS